jgi:DNA-binding NarL/FixJ family response regulator
MKPSWRILLADDHTVVLQGLRRILDRRGFEIVGTVGDGRALVEAVQEPKPDLIITDIRMPVLNGIQAAREIRKHDPKAKIIFLTMHTEPIYAVEAMKAGASGYLVKNADVKELTAAIRKVLGGGIYLTPALQEPVLKALACPRENVRAPVDRPMERQPDAAASRRGPGVKGNRRDSQQSPQDRGVSSAPQNGDLRAPNLPGAERFCSKTQHGLASSGVDPMQLRVLLVEDYAGMAAGLAKVFQSEGVDVRTAVTGKEALEAARCFRPQLIVCDMNLPDMKGLQVIRELRSNPSTQQTYAVILTAMSEWEIQAYKSNSEKLGVDAFISKPLRPQAIRDLVAKLRSQQIGAIQKPKIQKER